MVVERIDLAPGELGGQALGVPVGEQAHDDDRLLDPRRQSRRLRAARSIGEGLETAGCISDTPAMEARPAGPEGEGRCDALVAGNADAPGPQSEPDQVRTWRWPRRSTATGRQEEEAWALLIGVTEETTMRLGAVTCGELIHAPTLDRAIRPCLTNAGNYT